VGVRRGVEEVVHRHHLDLALLEPLARAIVVVLAVYGILRFQDLARRGSLVALRSLSYEASMFLLEILLGVVLPIALFAIPRVRTRAQGLAGGAFLVVLGFVVNRLNVSVTGMERAAGVTYFPSWAEIAISLALVAVGFAAFSLATKHLAIFPAARADARPVLPSWLGGPPSLQAADEKG